MYEPTVDIPSPGAANDESNNGQTVSKKTTCLVMPSPAQSVVGDHPPTQPQPLKTGEAGAERIAQALSYHFKPFTRYSYTSLKARILERRRLDEEKKAREEDVKLVDGQLVIDEDELQIDPKLAEGKALPKAVAKQFPKQLIGCPIEDIDPYCREYEESFMVITRRFNKYGYIVRFSASSSLFLFRPWNPIRRLALYTYVHPLFDLIIIFTILANSLYMAMNIDESVPEYTFLAIYTFEAIVKSLSRGIILTKHTYLRDLWNWLDFVVLVSAYATIIAQSVVGSASVNIQALRTFRVFRVLKTIAVIPGLKRIIEALIRAVKMLGDVYLMMFFFLTIFALFGIQIFEGTLKSKCVWNADQFNMSYDPNTTNATYVPWNVWVTNSKNWNMRDDGQDFQSCGNSTGALHCHATMTCLVIDSSPNPQADFTSYDNFYSSFMTAVQIFNTDYWDYLYDTTLSANGYGSFIWFVIAIVLLAYYLSNLFQAVVALSYQVEEEVDDEALEGAENPKPRLRFVFDPLKLRNLYTENARARSLLSVKEVTERKLGVRKNSLSTQSNQGSDRDAADDDAATLKEDKRGASETPNKDQAKKSKGKPVAVVKPQTKTDSGPGNDEAENLNLNFQKGLDKDGKKWPGFDNAARYRITSRPPSTVPKEDLPKIGFWDRNPMCCLVCCINYFPWLSFQSKVLTLVTDVFFELFIIGAIIVNTISMAAFYYGIPDDVNAALNHINDVCTYIFIVECILKLVALCGEYFANRWNWLDFAVVVGSVIDILFTSANITFAGFDTSIIRLLRLLRILKLAKSWHTMKMLLEIIFGTIGAIANLMLVLLIVIFIFAVIGMQLFGNAYTESKFLAPNGRPTFTTFPGFTGIPEWNWSDFFHAFMLVFRLLCRETYQPMWDCITASGAPTCIPFFLAVLMVGSYVVLNLFMAVLLNAFSQEAVQQMSRGDEDDRLRRRLKAIGGAIRRAFKRCMAKCLPENRRVKPTISHVADDVASTYFGGDNATTVAPFEDEVEHHVKMDLPKIEEETTYHKHAVNKRQPHKTDTTMSDVKSTTGTAATRAILTTARSTTQSVTGFSTTGSNETVRLRDCCWPFCIRRFPKLMRPFSGESCCGSCMHRARLTVLQICENKVFEYTILGFIFASSISLCLQDSTLVDDSLMDVVLGYLDYVFLAVFTIEMLLKIFALGIRVYFTSFWTILDFFIVVTGWVDTIMSLTASSSNLSALRALRTLRALRPLRAISRWQGMKIVVNALIASIPPIGNVLLVVLIIWLIFAIMGVQFFAGKFWYCVDLTTGNRLPKALVPDKATCDSNTNWQWSVYVVNFDHIGNAYLALLQMATFEGWTTIFQLAVDSADKIGQQPSPENNMYYYVYFLFFIIVCSFFLLNLFVGVIIDGFNALKKKYDGSTALQVFMTDSQKQYYNTIRKLGSRKPKKIIAKPKNKIGGIFFEIANSPRFEAASAFVIALNVIVLATSHYKQKYIFTLFQEMLELMFTTVFCLEAVVLLIAFRHYYFKNPWFIFDFIVIVMSVLSYCLADLLQALSLPPTVLHSLRLLRVGRVLRLVRASKGVRKIMFSFVMSIPALFNICCLLFLIIFIFSIIGMNLFGHLGTFGGNLDDVVNFRTFPNALMTLFRLTTMSGWDNVHQGLSFTDDTTSGCMPNISLSAVNYAQQNPCCNRSYWKRPSGEIVPDKSGIGNCGSYTLATIFCVSYLLCSAFIVVNMFAAVILDNYQQAVQQDAAGVTDDDIEIFYRVWEHFDPSATQFIPLTELQNFAASLEPPLACPKPNDHALTVLDIPILSDNSTNQEVVHCLDVLIALIRKTLGFIDESEEFIQVRETLESHFKVAFPNRAQVERISSTKQRKKQEIAARTIQKAWRNYQMGKGWKTAAKTKIGGSEANFSKGSSSPVSQRK